MPTELKDGFKCSFYAMPIEIPAQKAYMLTSSMFGTVLETLKLITTVQREHFYIDNKKC